MAAPQPDPAQTRLALRLNELAQRAERQRTNEPIRVIPVWTSPPDARVLGMFGEAAPEVAAALRIVRHRLETRRGEGVWTIAVTSARDGEGKSTLATQLALALSESQRARVLLIEASMHQPSLSRILGFEVPKGFGFSMQLANRMRGVHEPWTVLALGPALHALVESEAEPGFPQTLHSTHFRNAVERLGRVYDWVVVDAPSVLGSGDANVVEEAVDGMIVAVRSGASKGAALRAAMKQLGNRKALGVVLWDL
jgi:Mrp family chromosome partitioning ATPase